MGQMWVEADHYRDLEDAAGVGEAHDYCGDMMMLLRWAVSSKLLPPSINDSRALPLASLSRGADRDRRPVQMWRDVVKLLIEPTR